MTSPKPIRRSLNTTIRRLKNSARNVISTLIPGVRPGSMNFAAEKEDKIASLMKTNIEKLIPLKKGGKKSKTQKRKKNHRRTYKK